VRQTINATSAAMIGNPASQYGKSGAAPPGMTPRLPPHGVTVGIGVGGTSCARTLPDTIDQISAINRMVATGSSASIARVDGERFIIVSSLIAADCLAADLRQVQGTKE
jgi:hypothetical protein